MNDQFVIAFIISIFIVRMLLYYKPVASPTIIGMRLHHYMYGLLLILFSIIIVNQLIYAIGLALFIDEIPFLLLRGKTHEDNYSLLSILGVVILVGLVMIFQSYINIVGPS